METQKPTKISCLNEIFDKYTSFFFDMDGVLVFTFFHNDFENFFSGEEMNQFHMPSNF